MSLASADLGALRVSAISPGSIPANRVGNGELNDGRCIDSRLVFGRKRERRRASLRDFRRGAAIYKVYERLAPPN